MTKMEVLQFRTTLIGRSATNNWDRGVRLKLPDLEGIPDCTSGKVYPWTTNANII